MSLINEVLNQQLRHLLRAKRRADDRRTNYADTKRGRNRWRYHCNRRCLGGQDPRAASLPVGNRCIVPLLHIWLRLNDATPNSSNATRQRCMQRLRLRQPSLLDNVRQVIRIHWNNFRLMLMPEPIPVVFGPQRLNPQSAEIVRPQNRFVWLRKLRESFQLISKRLETALSNVGPSPDYVNTSAAMELVNLGDLIDQLNSALVDHLINNADYVMTPNPSLTALGLF